MNGQQGLDTVAIATGRSTAILSQTAWSRSTSVTVCVVCGVGGDRVIVSYTGTE